MYKANIKIFLIVLIFLNIKEANIKDNIKAKFSIE